MFHNLPDEINMKILDICKEILNPIEFYNLKNVNQVCKKEILKFKNLYEYFTNNHYQKINDKLNLLCCQNTSKETFQWLLNNKINFTLIHINNLIINNRKDILELGIKYDSFYKILFNKFYLYSLDQEEDIKNPIYISAKNNRFEILKFLIENDNNNDNNDNIIKFLFDISFEFINKKLLNFCIHNYYEIIKDDLKNKINIIIYKYDNIEDILFYLYLNNQIQFSNRILINCIKKKYNHFFQYSFNNIENKDFYHLLKISIQENNLEIFDYLLSYHNYEIKNDEFTRLIINNLDIYEDETKDFIYHILNNYKKYINKDCSLIERCIQCNMHSNTIRNLIYDNYEYSYYEIKLALQKKDIQLIKDLSNNLKDQ